jgi:hypothetical protein
MECLCDVLRAALDHLTYLRLKAAPQHGGCITGHCGKDKIWEEMSGDEQIAVGVLGWAWTRGAAILECHR